MSITRTLAKVVANYNNPKSLGSRLRRKRIDLLLDIIEEVYNENRSVNVIDIGGTESYWGIIPKEYFEKYNLTITIVNLPGIVMSNDHGHFRFIAADGCDLLDFDDGSFHIAHSNSVIEHVGDWERVRSFANEVSRIAPRYFVQTPNFWFPIEPHCMTPYFHWLPKRLRTWLVFHFQLGHWRKAVTIDEAVQMVENAPRLLNGNKFQELFKHADILTERIFWIPKSFIAVKR